LLSPVLWHEDRIQIVDQRRLPEEEHWVTLPSVAAVAEAIETLAIRGAPAIGIAAAMGCALAAVLHPGDDPPGLIRDVSAAAERLEQTRPTAVNLFWALARMRRRLETLRDCQAAQIRAVLVAEAVAIRQEDIESCRAIGRNGQALLPDQASVLTHCNAGALATGGYGTALGVVRAAVEAGKRIEVFADETRPLLQGARLTTWELMKDGIPVTLICDNMAGTLMRQGEIDVCLVGADRIAANGDAANKIGTYTVAVLARRHGLPFYVAAPFSSIDLTLATGDQIPIEERDPAEITTPRGMRWAPEGVVVRNPAFDVTPGTLISAIITERGVAYAPHLAEGLARLAQMGRTAG